MSASKGERLMPMTVNVTEAERRVILARVAERTVAEGRPVSVSSVVRELLREAAQHRGEAA